MRILALLAAIAAALTACAPDVPSTPVRVSHPDRLAGTAWQLVWMDRRPVPAGPGVTLVFGPADVSGMGPCNAFGGSYAYDAASGAIRIADLVSTKRACIEPGRNELEATAFAALRAAADASIDSGGRLVLSGAGARLVLAVGGVPLDLPQRRHRVRADRRPRAPRVESAGQRGGRMAARPSGATPFTA